MLPYKNLEDYKNWLRNRPNYHKDKMRQYRVEGRVSKSGIKYEFREFTRFKNNPKYAQRLAKELFLSNGNSERCKQLEALGVRLQAEHRHGTRPALGLKHACDKQCGFFGHVLTWISIEPVAYKVIFHGDFGDFNRSAYWIFKRYSRIERNPDFPEVKPVFECKKCSEHRNFDQIDDMFTFEHTCRLHYAITVYLPLRIARKTHVYCFNIGTILTGETTGKIVDGLTEEQFYAWLAKYRGLFLARDECRIEVRKAWG